jgi:hypothetical protein
MGSLVLLRAIRAEGGHSTAAEAGKVARAAGVERLVLTHFPARRVADPEELAAEGSSAFERAVEEARDLDVFDFCEGDCDAIVSRKGNRRTHSSRCPRLRPAR